MSLQLFNSKTKELINQKTRLSHWLDTYDLTFFSHQKTQVGILDVITLQQDSEKGDITKTKIYSLDMATFGSGNAVYISSYDKNSVEFVPANYFHTIHFNVESLQSKTYKVVIGVKFESDNYENVKVYEFDFASVKQDRKEIYNDFLTNAYLPAYDILEKAIISQDKAQLIKRLLLDYKDIMRSKGTDESIRKFLYFVGFDPESVRIFPEYKNTTTQEIIINPSQTQKQEYIKTGYYHVLFDNWQIIDPDQDNKHLTKKNLPYRPLNNKNIDSFFERLYYAITIANEYFTIPEQDISFFGLTNSTNSEKYVSIAGNMQQIHIDDVHIFRKDIFINLYVKEREKERTYLVENNKQKGANINKTEVKATIGNLLKPNNIKSNLILIEREVSDKEDIKKLPPFSYIRTFGNILHLELLFTRDLYVSYQIYDKKARERSDEDYTIFQEKFYLTKNTTHHIQYITKYSSVYCLRVEVYDHHNNRETYTYDYELKDGISRLDFDIFNSKHIFKEIKKEYNINSDIDSAWVVSADKSRVDSHKILSRKNTPDNLKDYFKDAIQNTLGNKTLLTNHRYILPSISYNSVLGDLSDTLINKYIDTHIEFCAFAKKDNHILIYEDPVTGEREPLTTTTKLYPDNLYINSIEVFIDKTSTTTQEYITITCSDTGINICKEIYKIYYVENGKDLTTLTQEDLIYNIEDFVNNKIPINFDVPIKHDKRQIIYKNNDNVIESLYPRLHKNSDHEPENLDTYYLKIGDVIVARVNLDLLTEFKNIKWTIYNAFDNSVLHTSEDFTLKYRINRKTIYNIQLDVTIYETKYTIMKKSIQSSIKY